jgi:hypothetical protein
VQEHHIEATPPPDSTPKKRLFWENRGNETQRLEEELMTTRIREMEVLTELKELRLKVMELETQVRAHSVGMAVKQLHHRTLLLMMVNWAGAWSKETCCGNQGFYDIIYEELRLLGCYTVWLL